MGIEEDLVSRVIGTSYEDLGEDVVESCKCSILDTLGVAIAGSKTLVAKRLFDLAGAWKKIPECSVWMHNTRIPYQEAVFLNGTMTRSLDFTQYHSKTVSHAMPTMLSIALATSEMRGGVSGREFITAVVMGAEVMCRMRLVPDYCSGLSGWTGTIHGVFGGAVTAGKLFNIDTETMCNALGIAYSQASGNSQGVKDEGGGETLALQQGLSARAAVMATMLSMKGLRTSRRWLSGSASIYETYYRGIPGNMDRLLNGFGQLYEAAKMTTKIYPCCAYNIGPVENVINIMKKAGLSRDDVQKVVVKVSQAAYNSACIPRETKYRPQIVNDAIFSMPYCVGTAIYRQDLFLDDFTDGAIKDAARLKEADKVETVLDPDIDREANERNLRQSLHIAEVITKDGKSYSQKMDYYTGTPQKPMDYDAHARKVRRCAAYVDYDESKMQQLIETVAGLEKVEDVKTLLALLN